MERLEDHLQELRRRLMWIVIALVVATAGAFYFSSDLLVWLQNDLGFQLNALTAYEVFYTQLMISVLLGFFISLPLNIYQVLKFVKPGLKDREYLVLRNYLPFSLILFCIGSVFAYTVIVKYSLSFFQQVTQTADVTAIWGLRNTIGYALKISAFTGLVFQLPVVSVVLARAGMLNAGMMKKYRAYFIIAVLLTSAMATPPDIFTQVLVTAPVVGLYQLSIWMVSMVEG